jgi:TetR/AcrR family transcriptional regulator
MTTQTRKEREKNQRRNEIIDAAQKKFFQKGYENVSMDEIAQDLELSKPTLYLYFQNKDALFLQVILLGLQNFLEEFRKATTKENTGKAKTLAFINEFFTFCTNNPEYYRLLVYARTKLVRTPTTNPQEQDGARQIGMLALESMNLLKDSVQLGVQDGTLRSDLEPLQTAIFLSIAAESAFQITPDYGYLLKHNNLTLEQYFHHSIDVIMRGIASSPK